MAGMVQTVFPALGTVNSITVYDAEQKQAVMKAKDYILSLEQRLSVFRADSEISRLNAKAGAWVQVSEDTFSLLQESVRYAELTEGAFDITAGPLSKLWREAIRTEQPPKEAALRREKRLVNYRDLLLDEGRKQAGLRRAGQCVDLGGIAKGYAADRITEKLRHEGVRNALLNLGGTVGALGEAQNIGIRNPLQPTGEPLGFLSLQDAFAVTSGVYERGFTQNGVRYHHILDPRSGMPANTGLCAVTLIGTNATELDALATATLILGAKDALPILQAHGIEAVFVTDTGEVLVTPNLKSTFRLLKKGA